MSNTEEIKLPHTELVYYYHPGFNKKHHRRVVAGLVREDKIYVSEAIAFTGKRRKIRGLEAIRNLYRAPKNQWEIKPDVFTKAKGRMIAVNRARAGNTILELTIPVDCTAPGKFFHDTVEAYYTALKFPPKVKKAKRAPASPEPGPFEG